MMVVLICERMMVMMTHSAIARGWPLRTKAMSDPDDLVCRWLRLGLVENRTSEIVSFSLLISAYRSHLHLSFLHARNDGLLV